ncbi:MAG: hypothetical protein MJZ61_02070 [Bacteroidales bacterium]|nr:hypothetical protein [Bacteroidales bacterium]
MNKKILICGSTPGELAAASQLDNADTLVYGVGAFQTIYNLGKALGRQRYDFVLIAGIAGEYNSDTPLLKTYITHKTTLADCGMESQDGGFQPIIGSRFLPADSRPFSGGYIINAESVPIAKACGLDTAACNTVNRISTQQDYVEDLLKRYPANIETMESAAAAYVCAMESIRYCEIRTTSNHTIQKKQEPWMLRESLEVLEEQTKKIYNKIIEII